MRNFEPWIGSEYQAEGIDGLRVLILGESHYGAPPERPSFTSEIIAKWGQRKRSKFFTVTQRLVSLDASRGYVPMHSRREFWEKVAFYNYVQKFVGTKARQRPTAEHWENAKQPLLLTIQELKPDVLVVLGKETEAHLPTLPSHIPVAYVSHPSGRGFSYNKWQPVVRAAFEHAKNGTQQNHGEKGGRPQF